MTINHQSNYGYSTGTVSMTCGACESAELDCCDGSGLKIPAHLLRGSPWGVPDRVEAKGRGVFWISTPSHGGFYLAPMARQYIAPHVLVATFNERGLCGWFEEDVDWCHVAIRFPDLFTQAELRAAEAIHDAWIKPRQC